MGSAPLQLAAELRDELSIRMAVETGTYLGAGTRGLAGIFDEVVSIELSESYHRRASENLSALEGVRLICGDSRHELRRVADANLPILYFLDGHWSGGDTAGENDECPVLEEVAAISGGHLDDCLVIDDARLFAAPPPPPHRRDDWPTLLEVFDAIRSTRPGVHLTVLDDQVIAVPAAAKTIVDRYGQSLYESISPKRPAASPGLGARVVAGARALRRRR